MHRTIIISEHIENVLINNEINEAIYYPDYEKVILIKNYLDKNYSVTNVPDVSSDGLPTSTKAINVIDSNNNIINTITPKDLFYMTQEKFKKIEKNTNDRDKLIKQVVNDWINGSITKEGGLSVNSI